MKKMDMFNTKVKAVDFPNHFEDTPSVIEYYKSLSGKSINKNRSIVVNGEEYIIQQVKPNEETPNMLRGFGGKKFLFYLFDGTILESYDTFFNGKTNKPNNAIKVENEYNPYNYEQKCSQFSTLLWNDERLNTVDKDERENVYKRLINNTLFVEIPWRLKEPINSNRLEYWNLKEYLELLSTIKIEDALGSALLKMYSKELSLAKEEFIVVTHNDNDISLLEYVYNTDVTKMDVEELEQLVLKSSWQYSTYPLNKELEKIKVIVRNQYISKQYRNILLSTVLEMKTKLRWKM